MYAQCVIKYATKTGSAAFVLNHNHLVYRFIYMLDYIENVTFKGSRSH